MGTEWGTDLLPWYLDSGNNTNTEVLSHHFRTLITRISDPCL
jgi:hypothetical protein